VDLPDPLTPVTTLNLPRGMLTLNDFRLCSFALTMRMELELLSEVIGEAKAGDGVAPGSSYASAKSVPSATPSPALAASVYFSALENS
jgi:hypothetical protein